MSINKINLPVDGTNITPNPNNLTGEAKKYQELCYKFPRTSEGQITFTAYPSGIVYNTEDYPTDPNIYNKGEDGMMNLLFKLYSGDGGFIVTVSDFSGGGGGYQGEFAYQELKDLISSNSLVIGGKYMISDYQTKYRQNITNVIKTADVEKLILTAVDINEFDIICSSLEYPQDTIYYDFNKNLCEDGTTPRNGFIIRRIDNNKNISIPNDWRKILYIRRKINKQKYYIMNYTTFDTFDVPFKIWTSGSVFVNDLYIVDNSVYMAIKTGVPFSNTDQEYFAYLCSEFLFTSTRVVETDIIHVFDGKQSGRGSDIFAVHFYADSAIAYEYPVFDWDLYSQNKYSNIEINTQNFNSNASLNNIIFVADSTKTNNSVQDIYLSQQINSTFIGGCHSINIINYSNVQGGIIFINSTRLQVKSGTLKVAIASSGINISLCSGLNSIVNSKYVDVSFCDNNMSIINSDNIGVNNCLGVVVDTGCSNINIKGITKWNRILIENYDGIWNTSGIPKIIQSGLNNSVRYAVVSYIDNTDISNTKQIFKNISV